MNNYFLAAGHHETPEEGRCAMEWVSFLAGEPHSDQPECVSRVLSDFCVTLNDWADNKPRQQLRPYLARTIGTAGDGFDEERKKMCLAFLRAHSVCQEWDLSVVATSAARAGVVASTGRLKPAVLELLDRMLPTELIQLPAVSLEEASAVCGVDVVCS